MGMECGECEHDLRGGHDPSCSRYRPPEHYARRACYQFCSRGNFLDAENGVVSICASPDECQGWRCFLGELA